MGEFIFGILVTLFASAIILASVFDKSKIGFESSEIITPDIRIEIYNGVPDTTYIYKKSILE